MTNFQRAWNLRNAFRQCFRFGRWKQDGDLAIEAEKVLRNLAQFCRANAPTFDADPRVHALLEGRREVWLEIQRTLELTDAQLFRLRGPEDE